jgi:hypothetical protein
MKVASLLLVLGLSACALTACGDDSEDEDELSDAETICTALDDCNLLTGLSYADCVEIVDEGLTSAKQDCAECVEGKSCSTLQNAACDAECTALFGG